MKKSTKVILITGLLVAVFAAGAASKSAETVTVTKNVPGPVVTKTVSVPGPERIVTKNVSVPGPATVTNKVPQSCLDALDAADEVISIAGDGFGYASDAIGSASNFDVDGLTTANENLSGSLEEMTDAGPVYTSAREACQSASN